MVGSGLRLGVGFVNPCQSWLGSWVGVFGLGLWCCPSFAGCLWCSWLGFGVALLLGRVWFRARCACPPPFPVYVCGVGVRAGPGSWLCPALPGWVVGVCFLRFFFPVVGCPCPGPCGLSPHPLSFGPGCWLFFFFPGVCLLVSVPLFPVGRCSWLGIAGFGWVVPLCLFWGPVFGALWLGGLAAFCVVGGRFGGCRLFSRGPPLPPPCFFFFLRGGGGVAVPPFAFPRLALALLLVCGVVGPSPPVCYSPPLPAGFRCRCWWAVPATPGWGPLAAVVCGGGVLVGLWLVCGVVGPSPLLAAVPVCYSPPYLAGFRCRWWWVVPATPGWGPLAAVVCGVWCVAVVCWWGCGWCVVWLVPRHSWRWFLCATPRHSWLGFAAGGGGRSLPLLAGVRWRRWCVVCGVWRWCVGGVVAGVWCGWSLATPGGGCCVLLPATPGWVSLPVVVDGPRHSWLGSAGGRGVWCVVCGGGVLVGLWLVCGVVGPSPLLAEVPVCYSPPLLAGFRCRWWWAVPATPGWGPLAALVCGVWCVAVVCWWGCGWCVVWLVPRHSWRWLLCATPRHSWLGFAAGVGGRSAPLLAGVRWRRRCVVCGVWRWCVGGVVAGVWSGWSLATPGGGSCVLLPATPGWVSLPVVAGGPRHSWLGSAGGVGVWCVACGGGVLVGLWLVCGVVGPSPLLAEVPVCYSPPLLAGFRCRWWWAVPATPGWGPLAAVVCGSVFAWPGRAGRPPRRVLVRLTFSFGRFVLLFCLAPSGLGLLPSLSLLLPFLVALALCFGCCFPASRCLALRALAPRLCLLLGRWLLPRPPPLLCLAVFVPPAWCLGVFFFSFLCFLCPPPLSLAFSGIRPRVPWASALALFALLACRLSALSALVPLSCCGGHAQVSRQAKHYAHRGIIALVSCDKAFQGPCHSETRGQKNVQHHIRICTHGVKTGLG